MESKECRARDGGLGSVDGGLSSPYVPGWCHYSDIVVKARAFDAIDLGGGRRRGEIDALADSVALQTQVDCPAGFCPYVC